MGEPRILTDDELRQIGALQVTPGSWHVSDRDAVAPAVSGPLWLVAVVHGDDDGRPWDDEVSPGPGPLADADLIAAAPDLRRTALHLLQRAERAEARVTELEAPGECQSLHKLRAEVARLEAELAKPVAGAWAPHPCAGLARRELRLDAASDDDIAAGFTDGGWWVNVPGPSGGIVASGLETGEEGRRLADAAAVAAGWRLL